MSTLDDFFASRIPNGNSAGAPSYGGSTLSGYPGLPSVYYPQGFMENKRALDSALADLDGVARNRSNSNFSMSNGTQGLYDSWKGANFLDRLAIEAERGADWWYQLPSQIAGALAGDKAKEDWYFDPNKFNLLDGLDSGDMTQARNFVASLPGMMVGGVFEGLGDLYEASTGRPINEYRQASSGEWEIPNYQLDASQRAADFIDSAINIGGMFTGGSGRIIGALGSRGLKSALGDSAGTALRLKAIGASDAEIAGVLGISEKDVSTALKSLQRSERTEKALERMSQGIVTRAVNQGGKRNLGTAVGLAADAGDEAAEEFVQSYAEDVRNKTIDDGSLDRALTGAAWGAAGGGLMGGAGRLISRIASPSDTKAAQGSTDEDDFDKAHTVRESELASLRSLSIDRALIPKEGREYIDDSFRQNLKAPASFTTLMTSTDPTLGFRQTVLGANEIKNSFYSDDTSAEKTAALFGMTADEMNVLFRSGKDVAKTLTERLKQFGHRQIVVGRNPDTKNGGFYMDLVGVVDGDALQFHPAVASYVGADWDGDRCSVYLDPNDLYGEDEDVERRVNLNVYGYVTDHLLSFETSSSTVDWAFAGFDNETKINKAEVKRQVDEILTKYGYVHEEGLVTKFVEELENAISEKDADTRNYLISKALTDFQAELKSIRGNHTNLVSEGRVVDEVIASILTDPRAIGIRALQQFKTDVANTIDAVDISTEDKVAIIEALGERVREAEGEINKATASAIREWSARGTTGGATKVFQLAKDYGLLTYLLNPNSKYNPIYRQYGLLRYAVNSVPGYSEVSNALTSIFGVDYVATDIVRSAFRLCDPGTSPMNAIEGMVDSLAGAEIVRKLHLAGNPLTEANLETFKSTVIEVQGQYADMYNQIISSDETSKGFAAPFNAMYQTKISSLSEEGERNSKLFRYVSRLFGDTNLSDLIDNNILEKLALLGPDGRAIYTLSEFAETYAKYGYTHNIDLKLKPIDGKQYEAIRNFLRSLVNNYGSEREAVIHSIKEQFSNIKITGIRQRFIANGNKLDPRDINPMLELFEFFYDLVGAENCLSIRFVLSDEFFNTEPGRIFLEGDPDKMLNLAVSASIYSQYITLIEELGSDNMVVRENATEKIRELGNISYLHREISDALLSDPENPNREVFDALTDLSWDINEKSNSFEAYTGLKYAKSDIILSAFQNEVGKFSVSSVSAKIRKAQSALSRLQKSIIDNAEGEVTKFFTKIDNLGPSNQKQTDFVKFVKARALDNLAHFDDALVSMKILASLTLNNDFVEKATVGQIFSALYNANAIGINGGLFSELSCLVSAENGVIDASDWLDNRYHVMHLIADENYVCEVFDPVQGKRVEVSQKALIESVSPNGNGELDYPTLKAIFTRYPHLAGMLCQDTVNIATQNGNMGVQAARTYTLEEAFENWAKPRKSTDAEALENDSLVRYEVDNLLQRIRSWIFNSPEMQYLITASINPDVLEGKIDERRLTSEVSKAMDSWSYYLLGRLGSGSYRLSELEDKTPENLAKTKIQTDTMNSLWNVLNSALKLDLSFLDTSVKKATQDIVVKEALKALVANKIAVGDATINRVNDIGVNYLDEVQTTLKRLLRIMGFALKDQSKTASEILNTTILNQLDISELQSLMGDGITEEEARKKVTEACDEVLLESLDLKTFDEDNFFIWNDEIDGLRNDTKENRKALLAIISDRLKWNPFFFESKGDKKSYVQETVDSFFDTTNENETEHKTKQDRLIRSVNMILADRELNGISDSSFMRVNSNALQMMDESIAMVEDSVKKLQNYIFNGGSGSFQPSFTNNWSLVDEEFRRRNVSYKVLPELHLMSQTVQASISNQKANDPAASNPTKVGMNGGEGKKVYPFGHIPQSVPDLEYAYTVPVKKKDAGELSWMTRHSGENVVGPNGTPIKISLDPRSEYQQMLLNLGDDADIQWFSSEANPHGLPTLNMMSPESDPLNRYHRVSGIFEGLVDYSQEQEVLKTKKLMRVVDEIIKARSISRNDGGHRIVGGNIPATSIIELFGAFRTTLEQGLVNAFGSNELKGLGYGPEQARIMTQVLTPGIKIAVFNPETGKEELFVLDSTNLFGADAEAKTTAYLSRILSGEIAGDNISRELRYAEVLAVTPLELAHRIMNAINNERDANGAIIPSDAEAAALQALNDWSDYSDVLDGSLDMLLSRITPVSFARSSFIVAEDNPSKTQWLNELEYDGSFGISGHHHIKQDKRTAWEPLQDSRPREYANYILGRFNATGYNTELSPVFQIWLDPSMTPESDPEVYPLVSDLNYQGIHEFNDDFKNKTASGKRPSMVCFDKERIGDAVNWCKKRGFLLVVPTKFNTLVEPFLIGNCEMTRGTISGVSNARGALELTVFDPRKSEQFALSWRKIPKSHQTPRSIRDIRTCAILPPSMKILGDAQIAAYSHTWLAKTYHSNTVRFSFDEICPRVFGPKSFVSAEEAHSLLDKIADFDQTHGVWVPKMDDSVWRTNKINLASDHVKNNSHIGKNDRIVSEIKEKIVSYLADIDNKSQTPGSDGKSFTPDRIEKNSVAALIRDDNGNISPVVLPSDIPVVVTGYRMYIQDQEVVVDYAGHSPMFQEGVEGSQKWQLDGETFKGMISRLLARDGKTPVNAPSLSFDGKIVLDFLGSSETEQSRVGGMDEILLARALYYRLHMEDFNLFYEKDSNGNYKLAEFVEGWKKANLKIYNQFVSRDSLDKAFWLEALATCSFGTNDAQVRAAIKNCLRYNADPMMVFGNYRLFLEKDKNGRLFLSRHDFVNSDGSNGGYFMETAWEMILQNTLSNPDEMLKLFYAVDKRLCANGVTDTTRPRTDYYIGANGLTLVRINEGVDYGISFSDDQIKKGYAELAVRYGFHQILGETTLEQELSGLATISGQHIGRRAGDIGYSRRNLEQGIIFNNMATGDYSDAILRTEARRLSSLKKKRTAPLPSQRDDFAIEAVVKTPSARNLKKLEKITTLIRTTFGRTRKILTAEVDENGNRKEYDPTDMTSPLTIAISEWNQYIVGQGGNAWTIGMLDSLAKCYTASSYTGTGDFTITEKRLSEDIKDMLANIKAGKLPVTVVNTRGVNPTGRFCMPLLPREVAIWVWNSVPSFAEQYHNNFNEFVEAMTEEQTRAEDAISSLPENKVDTSKRKSALVDMARALRLEWNQTSTILPVWEDYFPTEIKKDYNRLGQAFAASLGWSQETIAVYDSLCEMSMNDLMRISNYMEQKYNEQIKLDKGSGSESVVYEKARMARDLANILNNAAELSKVMALCSPLVTAGNLVDRLSHQGMARLWLWMGQKLRLGPYAVDPEKVLKKSIREKSVSDAVSVRIYQSYRQMEFRSEEKALLMNLLEEKNFEAAIKFLDDRQAELTKFGKACDFIYKTATGFDLGIESQMGLALDRFVMFADEEGQTFWFEPTDVKDENGHTLNRLEAMLASPNGFAKFMFYCLGSEGYQNAPSYGAWMKAMNWAKAGDLAQQNALGLVLSDICSRIPLSNFFVTTMVSKFPTYGLNVTGRALNYILPISTMNYVFTKVLGETELGKNLGVKETQIHTSLQEAILVDICKLGIGGVAIALFGISGAVNPPDDEDKWGNVNEWLLFGSRASANWWIQDILGMALPLACFWKSCELGKPRFDILTNGIKSTCYANPLMRTTDLAEFILNPAESLVTDYTQDFKEYQDAKGGAPEWGQWFQANAFNGTANYLLQFITPSILKDLYQASQPLEKSVKRIYSTAASGRENEAGVYGATERTTYADAQIRRLAKRNPVFALGWSLVSGKSYWAGDMPDTVYYDDYQLAGSNLYSVSGLEGSERDAKMIELIGILQSYDNLDDLAKTGFFLDRETSYALANQVWANYHAWDEWYLDLKNTGQLDYYVLGDGDYNTGRARADEIYAEKEKWKQYWYNFYYQKLKNSPILGKMQVYNRYNTTYATDANGDFYATGIRRFPYNLLPINIAPGTTENPEGTAGYANDFMTVSAVTGEPLSNRALIPRTIDIVDLPDFDELNPNESGGSSRTAASSYGTPTSTTKATTPGYGGGYTRGGSAGGGGGGGGYTPNIYAPSVSIPKSNTSRIMTRDRLQRPQYDYLRPDFETKGSREAYKRSDI